MLLIAFGNLLEISGRILLFFICKLNLFIFALLFLIIRQIKIEKKLRFFIITQKGLIISQSFFCDGFR